MTLSTTVLPLLEESRMDYANSTYRISVDQGDDKHSMDVRHEIQGKNLVASLLKESKAVFAVEVSSPYATFRHIEKSEIRGEISCTQKVSWDAAEVVPPVYIRPIVVVELAEPQNIKLSTERHGVHSIWDGREIQLRSGTILAIDQFWAFRSTFESLLRLLEDPKGELKPGEYKVEESSSEGFHFKVTAHPELYSFLVTPPEGQGDYRNGILTSALTVGFEILRREYGSKEGSGNLWEEFPVLRELHTMLENEGIATWDNEDFHAEVAAARFRPFKFSGVSNADSV